MNNRTQNNILVIGVTVAIIGLNILLSGYSGQIDLTYDQRYTLAPATRNILGRLQDPVTVKAYFSRDLPPPYSTVSTYVQDLLEEYYSVSGGQVRYQFIDPATVKDEEDEALADEAQVDLFGRPVHQDTKLETELYGKGIMPARIRVNDNDKLEERRVYLGLELIYGENSSVIPLVQDVARLEYEITSRLRKMSREKLPKIGLPAGHDSPEGSRQLEKFLAAVGEQYQIEKVDLTTAEIPEDLALLALIGPRGSFSEDEIRKIDGFVQSGRGVAFILDSLEVNLDDFSSQPLEHGLLPLITAYGLEIEPGIVGDAQGASVGVQQRQGYMVINQPVKYYYMPLVSRFPRESAIASGLGPVPFAFTSPLTVKDKRLNVQILAASTNEAWREISPIPDLNPLQDWNGKNISFSPEPIPLALTADGIFSSPYGQEGRKSRIALFGGSYFLEDQFLQPAAVSLLLNTFDWLNGDDELLAMRSRGMSFALLDADIPDGRRNFIKFGNIFGGPAALVVIGLLLWYRRGKKKTRLQANKPTDNRG